LYKKATQKSMNAMFLKEAQSPHPTWPPHLRIIF